jgi:hypothetical protein
MSQVNARLVYRNALRAMQRANIDPSTAILSQSFLKLEVIAATNKTNYQFGVLVNDNIAGQPSRPTETRLNLQDAFYCGTVQIYTSIADSINATDYAPITWNNPFQFSTAGAAVALNNFYNGYYSLTVNNRVISTAMPIVRHKHVPILQQNNAAGNGINSDAFDGVNSTAYACEPNWVLIGSKNNQLTMNLPAAIGTLQANKTTVITMLLSGILAQNVTVVS